MQSVKDFYEQGVQKTNKITEIIVDQIRQGWSNEQMREANSTFYFHNRTKIVAFRADLNRDKILEPVDVNRVQVPVGVTLHISADKTLEWYHRTCVDKICRKGSGWLHIYGPTNQLKSWFIKKTFGALYNMGNIIFREKTFPSGFQENTYHCLFSDGIDKTKIKNGFDLNMIEHCTMGVEDKFVFPAKFVNPAPQSNGEFWVTTGNYRIEDIGSFTQKELDEVVLSRVSQIKFDVRLTQPVELANLIRGANGLPAVRAPVPVRPINCHY